MTIEKLKQYVDEAYEKGKECSVEFWIKLDDDTEILAELDSIGQFSIIPDMTLTVKPNNDECKIYSSDINPKQLDYMKMYKQLRRAVENLYNNME